MHGWPNNDKSFWQIKKHKAKSKIQSSWWYRLLSISIEVYQWGITLYWIRVRTEKELQTNGKVVAVIFKGSNKW